MEIHETYLVFSPPGGVNHRLSLTSCWAPWPNLSRGHHLTLFLTLWALGMFIARRRGEGAAEETPFCSESLKIGCAPFFNRCLLVQNTINNSCMHALASQHSFFTVQYTFGESRRGESPSWQSAPCNVKLSIVWIFVFRIVVSNNTLFYICFELTYNDLTFRSICKVMVTVVTLSCAFRDTWRRRRSGAGHSREH